MNTCRACHAPVLWCKTLSGKSMPLDPTPVAGGNIALRAGVAVIVEASPLIERYVAHHATCPQADQFRPKRKKRAHG